MEKNNVEIDKLREGIVFAARGGGVRSATAIGILKALEEANIPVKLVCGESGSSLVAALLAYGYNAEEIRYLFLKHCNAISKAAKIYGGRGSIVIEELVNKETNSTPIKDLPLDISINCAKGSLLKPQLHLFNKVETPDETLGFACSASAGLPIFYGNTHKIIDGKKIKLFDGGMLYNPYIPEDVKYPIVYASFANTIDYQRYFPFLQNAVDIATERADVIITTPVGGALVTGSNELIENLIDAGYEQAKMVLRLK